jgi:hypothetical protein
MHHDDSTTKYYHGMIETWTKNQLVATIIAILQIYIAQQNSQVTKMILLLFVTLHGRL